MASTDTVAPASSGIPHEVEKKSRYAPGEVIISEVTEDDLEYLAEGYYAAFGPEWHDSVEPPSTRTPSFPLRVSRLAARMKPWLTEPHLRLAKATLSPTSPSFDPEAPGRVIGHAVWQMPARTEKQIMNIWRRDASEKLGWRGKMGWTEGEEEELWEGFDMSVWQGEEFLPWDKAREGYLKGVGHWYLSPIWVLPEHQGRGVSSLLLQDAFAIADKADPPQPLYLEALPNARPVYVRHGYLALDGEGKKFAMIRNVPDVLKPMLLKEDQD